MELNLKRIDKGERGTNGLIVYNGTVLCSTIERPWINNQRRISCIPEGTYELQKRHSEKFGWHLWVKDVPGRDLILIHPANDAMKELNGCIAPVTTLTGMGKGVGSRAAVSMLFGVVHLAMEKGEKVYLTVTD